MIDRCDEEDPPSTHDEGDQWASGARSGRERCGVCGMEWSVGDGDVCRCEEGDGEEEEEE